MKKCWRWCRLVCVIWKVKWNVELMCVLWKVKWHVESGMGKKEKNIYIYRLILLKEEIGLENLHNDGFGSNK